MNKFYKLLIGIGLIAYFLFLVISRMPAAYAVMALHSALPNLWLTGVSGTIWSGTAQASQVDIDQHSLPLGQVNWDLKVWSLLFLRPCLDLRAEQPGQIIAGNLCHQIGGASYVKDMSIDGSLAAINPLLPFEIKGVGALQIINGVYNFKQNSINKLDAQFSWQNGRFLAIDNWLALGSFAAKFKENEEGGLAAEVFDLQGPLKVNVVANWTAEAGWTASGTVSPQAGTPEQVVQGLQVIGEEVSAGTYKLVWP